MLRLSNLVLDRPLVFVDVESTGVDPARDRVVEVAALKQYPNGRVTTYAMRVNPGIPIPAAAAAVHGITDADVASAPPFAAVARELSRGLAGCDVGGFGVVAFDLPLLAAEFARAGVGFRVAGRRVLDAMTIFHRYEPRDLTAAVRFYLGRDHPAAHTAAADVAAAAEVLDRQVAAYGLPGTPAELRALLSPVDAAGRFRRDAGGRAVFAFGKHAGRPLADVAVCDPTYLEWMLGRPFLDDVHDLIRRAIAREPIDPPAANYCPR